MPGQKLPSRERLRATSDFQRCYRTGGRLRADHLAVYSAPNQLGHPRIGVTASRKVGRATVRNRLKRQAREVFRQWPSRHRLPALDLVVHYYPRAQTATFSQLEHELGEILERLTR